MPLFQKKKGDKKNKGGLTENEQHQPEEYHSAAAPTAGPTVPAPNAVGAPPPPAAVAANPPVAAPQPSTDQPPPPSTPQRKLEFYTQLAHGSSTAKIEGFGNVRELYVAIAKAFLLSAEDILFCTLNTHKVDMEFLLGGQIGLNDLIVAHVKGSSKFIKCMKSDASLGLTITDNGAGYAFIKRIKENSTMAMISDILVGDHIQSINDKTMIGARHFEVARAFKELPVGLEFSVSLVEPRKAFTKIAPRAMPAVQPMAILPTSDQVSTGKETLRLRSTGPAEIVQEEQTPFETIAITKCDDLLESYIGIRDDSLAETLVNLFKGKADFTDFMVAVGDELGELDFPEEFIFDLWGVMGDVKDGRV